VTLAPWRASDAVNPEAEKARFHGHRRAGEQSLVEGVERIGVKQRQAGEQHVIVVQPKQSRRVHAPPEILGVWAAVIVHAWLDIRPVLRNRDALALMAGYAATIWGTAGLRQWIVVFLAFRTPGQAGVVQGWTMMWAGALIGLLGVPAGLLGNELALRVGLRDMGLRFSSAGVGIVQASDVLPLLNEPDRTTRSPRAHSRSADKVGHNPQ
jgi:hypothetical protein